MHCQSATITFSMLLVHVSEQPFGNKLYEGPLSLSETFVLTAELAFTTEHQK